MTVPFPPAVSPRRPSPAPALGACAWCCLWEQVGPGPPGAEIRGGGFYSSGRKETFLLTCCDNALLCIVLYIWHVPFRASVYSRVCSSPCIFIINKIVLAAFVFFRFPVTLQYDYHPLPFLFLITANLLLPTPPPRELSCIRWWENTFSPPSCFSLTCIFICDLENETPGPGPRS